MNRAGDPAAAAERVVAVDGPAGSGKSTVSRMVAARLGLDHLDTGAQYRAVACAVLRRDVSPVDEDGVAAVAADAEIAVDGDRVTVDGEDATEEIRGAAVTGAVSAVAANPRVREILRRSQREWAAAHGGGVVEGRDIGTAVFPEAAVKVYVTASPSERARRRAAESGGAPGEIERQIRARDDADSTRTHDPLAVADDAVRIDTTGMSIDEVVDAVVALVRVRRP